MTKIIQLQNIEEHNEFIRNNRRCVIFYGAIWCNPCSEMKVFYGRIADRYSKRLPMAFADIDKIKIHVNSIPTFISYRKGNKLETVEGANRDKLKVLVSNILTTK